MYKTAFDSVTVIMSWLDVAPLGLDKSVDNKLFISYITLFWIGILLKMFLFSIAPVC